MGQHFSGFLVIMVIVLAAAIGVGSCFHGPAPIVVDDHAVVRFTLDPARGFLPTGGFVRILPGDGQVIHCAHPMWWMGEWQEGASSVEPIVHGSANEALMTPTAMRWYHPKGGLPFARVLWVSERLPDGRITPPAKHTYTSVDHGDLHVLSLTAHPGSWFDPDTGIMVVGNGIFKVDGKTLDYYANDPRWWKYPGNFHGRGRKWERHCHVELFDAEGNLLLHSGAGVRINGQMTRGFPQHALRLSFDQPHDVDLWGPGSGGVASLVVRAAGNDQVKAMMRDVYQHRMCETLPFEVSKGLTCVMYVNGAYWGLHHLRQRLDEQELARRWNVSPKDISIVEDRGVLYRGDEDAPEALLQLVAQAAHWNGADTSVLRELHRRLDVEEFLTYMAAQLVLGNMDWPRQNVKFWRYEGPAQAGNDLDDRWHMAMGDSDLGFGAVANASADMFQKVRPKDAPASRLFMGLMRSPVMLARFKAIARELVDGPLSPERCLQELDRMYALMGPEMVRHTARWRKPADIKEWRAEVEVMRTFAQQRRSEVIAQLHQFNGR